MRPLRRGALATLAAILAVGTLACASSQTASSSRVAQPANARVQGMSVTSRSPLDVSDGAVSCVEAIRFAWANAPRVRAASALVAVADAKRTELRAGYLPQVNLGATLTTGFSGSGSNLGVRGMIASPFVHHWAVGLEASWSALEFLRIEPRVDVANAEGLAARAEQERIERDVALMMIDLYERILVVEGALQATDAEIAWREAHVKALVALVAGGAVPPTDLLQARASLARAVADRALAVADRDGLRAVLATLVGDPRMTQVALLLDAPTTDAIATAEGRAANAYREAATRLRSLSWREALPRVVVGGSVGYANPPAGQDAGLWAVGVSAVVPLTAPFVAAARDDAAASTEESKAFEADARAEQLELERSSLRANVRAFEAAIPAMKESARAVQEALRATQSRVDGGLNRELEVEAIRVLLTRSLTDEATLRIRLAAAEARLAWIGESRR